MPQSRIAVGTAAEGLERLDVFLKDQDFTPHSHDTYAVGVTTAGIQAFNYRGEIWRSLPRQVFVLHPGERHDGRAGDRRGFGYRIAYVDPALIGAAAEAISLPHLREPVSGCEPLREAIVDLVSDQDEPLDEVRMVSGITALADALVRAAGRPGRARMHMDSKAMATARDLLLAKTDERVSIAELEHACGLSRWHLSRQFRQAYGVSPYRFHLIRRVDRARERLRRGDSLASAALQSGFADQAHLSRHFRRTYGLTPGRWRALVSGRRD